jgi:hypothetical protein
MPRIRLKICGAASIGEAQAAVAAGADAVGLDPRAFPDSSLAGNDMVAGIALALPPAVTPVLLTQALTAGTIAQQIDAAAAVAVQIERPLPPSEYPGLKRIIRGRKIIQSIQVDAADALALAHSYIELADALHLVPATAEYLPLCRQIGRETNLPIVLRLQTPDAMIEVLPIFRPFAVDVGVRFPGGQLDEQVIASLTALLG